MPEEKPQNGSSQWPVLAVVLTVIGTLATVMHQRIGVTEAAQTTGDAAIERARDGLHQLELALEKVRVELGGIERLHLADEARLSRVQEKGEEMARTATAIAEKLKEVETQFREARSFTTLSDAQLEQRIANNLERITHVERLIQNGPDSMERRLGVLVERADELQRRVMLLEGGALGAGGE